MVKNATHLDPVPVPAVKGFLGTVDQNMVATWHQVFWLGRGVEAIVGLADATIRFALGVVVPSAYPATAWQLINVVLDWRPPKQAKSGLWSITCPCDVQTSLCIAYVVEVHALNAIFRASRKALSDLGYVKILQQRFRACKRRRWHRKLYQHMVSPVLHTMLACALSCGNSPNLMRISCQFRTKFT